MGERVLGHVAGTWRHERGRIELEPFEPIPKTARRELRDEADRLVELWRDDPSRLPARAHTRAP